MINLYCNIKSVYIFYTNYQNYQNQEKNLEIFFLDWSKFLGYILHIFQTILIKKIVDKRSEKLVIYFSSNIFLNNYFLRTF